MRFCEGPITPLRHGWLGVMKVCRGSCAAYWCPRFPMLNSGALAECSAKYAF